MLKDSLSEEYLKILEAVSEVAIIAYTDSLGRITFANDNFCKISGYTMDELYKKDHRILNSNYHEKAFFKEMYTALNNGKKWRGEIRNRRKDGSFYWVDTQIIPILNEVGEIESLASIRFDITERKIMEKTKVKMEKLATSLEMAKAVAHEVNNPLTIIDLCCLSLNRELEDKQSNEVLKNKIEKIFSQSKRIASKVKELHYPEVIQSSQELSQFH